MSVSSLFAHCATTPGPVSTNRPGGRSHPVGADRLDTGCGKQATADCCKCVAGQTYDCLNGASGRRAFRGQTCHAEVIVPHNLADILRTAIEARIDRHAFADVPLQRLAVRWGLLDCLGGD
jgi:hypothetical protein